MTHVGQFFKMTFIEPKINISCVHFNYFHFREVSVLLGCITQFDERLLWLNAITMSVKPPPRERETKSKVKERLNSITSIFFTLRSKSHFS